MAKIVGMLTKASKLFWSRFHMFFSRYF